jgi:6-phosphogluconate dehydrogenase
MKIAMVGLGKMGMNMAIRLLRDGHQVVAYNRTFDKTQGLAAEGAEPVETLEQMVRALPRPRVVWLMLPAGNAVDEQIEKIAALLESDDILVDGGNSNYHDDLRRAEKLSAQGIHYVDAGVSGGIWGLEKGYCMMLGGERQAYQRLKPILDSLAPPDGHLYCGPSGAGHFVKMVHNGIEYGMMQAYAEGFDILQASPYADRFDYAELSKLWNRGSVIRSWLLELLEQVFTNDPRLENLEAWVEDSGEGRWAVQQALDTGVPAEVMTISLMRRFSSRQPKSFADRMLAALRNAFGGHAVVRKQGQ